MSLLDIGQTVSDNNSQFIISKRQGRIQLMVSPRQLMTTIMMTVISWTHPASVLSWTCPQFSIILLLLYNVINIWCWPGARGAGWLLLCHLTLPTSRTGLHRYIILYWMSHHRNTSTNIHPKLKLKRSTKLSIKDLQLLYMIIVILLRNFTQILSGIVFDKNRFWHLSHSINFRCYSFEDVIHFNWETICVYLQWENK